LGRLRSNRSVDQDLEIVNVDKVLNDDFPVVSDLSHLLFLLISIHHIIDLLEGVVVSERSRGVFLVFLSHVKSSFTESFGLESHEDVTLEDSCVVTVAVVVEIYIVFEDLR